MTLAELVSTSFGGPSDRGDAASLPQRPRRTSLVREQREMDARAGSSLEEARRGADGVGSRRAGDKEGRRGSWYEFQQLYLEEGRDQGRASNKAAHDIL